MNKTALRFGALLACAMTFVPAVQAADKPQIDTGDTAWLLMATVLVLMMNIPGLALFYAGMVRKKNVLATSVQAFAVAALVTILWFAVGYSLAFTDGGGLNGAIGSLSRAFGKGLLGSVHELAKTVPENVFLMYQATFAVITPAIIAGAFAERMKFSAMMWFMALWSLIVYAPIAHWVWGGGFLGDWGVLDYAGGTVVHINAGVAGLVCALVLGKRKGFGTENLAPYNLVYSVIGVIAGSVCYWASIVLKNKLGYDDSLDAFGVHGVGGIVGSILVGVFATRTINDVAKGQPVGLVDGNGGQILTQLYGVVVIGVFCAVATWVILKILDVAIGLRVTQDEEVEGLDTALHGERVQ